MRPLKPLLLLFLLLGTGSSFQLCQAKDLPAAQLAREFNDQEKLTDVQQCNLFVKDGTQFATHEKQRLLNQGVIYARLLTPLNSSVAGIGDSVYAEVTASAMANGRPWLPKGTILEGTVEGARKATFARTDGAIALRFYKARFEETTVELSSAPDNDDGELKPGAKKRTKKQKVRGVLMMATRMAVPMALGSFGMSIAITTGAGAIIGGVLADDHKYVQGAVDGAWEGSGLGMLDPLVRKGNTVVMPVDSPIALKITEDVAVPVRLLKLASVRETAKPQMTEDLNVSLTSLETSAKVVSATPAKKTEERQQAAASELQEIDHFINLGNLAKALDTARLLDSKYQGDEAVHKKYVDLLDLVTRSTTHSSSAE